MTSTRVGTSVQVAELHGDVHFAAAGTDPPDRRRKILVRTAWIGGLCVIPAAAGLLLAAQIPKESHGATASSPPAPATASTTTASSVLPAQAVPPKTGTPVRSAPQPSTLDTSAATSNPTARYAAPPDLTGNWLLHFKELNFGDNGTHDYTIALSRLDDGKCGGAPPCYGGVWYSVEAKNFQGGNVVALSSISADGGKLLFTATDTDEHGKQTYNGTAPNDTTKQLIYSGDWSDTTGRAATFTFLRQA